MVTNSDSVYGPIVIGQEALAKVKDGEERLAKFLHKREMHPDYLYAQTDSRKDRIETTINVWLENGWEWNVDKFGPGPLKTSYSTFQCYWRRRITTEE